MSIYYLTNFPALLHFPKNDKCSSKTFQLHCLLIVRMCAIFLVRYFSYLNLFYSSRKVRLSLLRRHGSILANPICAKARKIARVPIFENVKWLNNKSLYRFRVQRTAGEHRAHSKPSGHRHRQEPGHLHEEKVAAHHAHCTHTTTQHLQPHIRLFLTLNNLCELPAPASYTTHDFV